MSDYWTAIPATNRFQQVLVAFNDLPNAFFNVAVKPSNNTTDPSTILRQDSNILLTNPRNSIFQNIECIKYHIDGQKACSIILVDTNGGVLEQVVSYVHSNMFSFFMVGTQENFDSYLPTFNKMLASFKTP